MSSAPCADVFLLGDCGFGAIARALRCALGFGLLVCWGRRVFICNRARRAVGACGAMFASGLRFCLDGHVCDIAGTLL